MVQTYYILNCHFKAFREMEEVLSERQDISGPPVTFTMEHEKGVTLHLQNSFPRIENQPTLLVLTPNNIIKLTAKDSDT